MNAKDGDYVTAIPSSEEMQKDYPVVTGRLEISKADFMGEEWEVLTVHAVYPDGDDCPVEVKEDGIFDASPRRTERTVVKLLGED